MRCLLIKLSREFILLILSDTHIHYFYPILKPCHSSIVIGRGADCLLHYHHLVLLERVSGVVIDSSWKVSMCGWRNGARYEGMERVGTVIVIQGGSEIRRRWSQWKRWQSQTGKCLPFQFCMFGTCSGQFRRSRTYGCFQGLDPASDGAKEYLLFLVIILKYSSIQ